MTTYISILRGINVGGHKKIKMDALRQLYSDMGYSHVLSYIQSGNIIFDAIERNVQILEIAISKKISETFGFEVPVIVLTNNDMKDALKNNPYQTDSLKDPTKIYLTFLSNVPDKSILDAISPAYYAPDEFAHWGKVIYNYCPNGYGNTKLTNTFFEKKLTLTATSRNLKTITELLVLAEGAVTR